MTASMAQELEVSGAAFAAILKAAADAWPVESCGVLVGRRDGACVRVTRAVAARNVAENRGQEFEVDPRTLLTVHREAREAGDEVLGPYHSHPNGSARPSVTDAARAVEAGECWLIVPVHGQGNAGDPRAFVFDGAAFTEIRLSIAG